MHTHMHKRYAVHSLAAAAAVDVDDVVVAAAAAALTMIIPMMMIMTIACLRINNVTKACRSSWIDMLLYYMFAYMCVCVYM